MGLASRRLGALGVEVLGLDLRDGVSDADWQALRELVMEEGLVLFRDQPMEARTQIELGQRFGELENTSVDGGPMDESQFLLSNVDERRQMLASDDVMMQLVAINEGWHTDSSFRELPASFSLFSAVTVPEEGGDTIFASMQLGWDSLSEAEQSELYGLRALHDYNQAYAIRDVDVSDVFGGEAPSASHPIVRRHPETGRTGLFISEHVFAIEGMPAEEGRALSRRLLLACVDPSRVYRHHWSVGDVLIWDNRSMLHRAQGFDSKHPRVMRHVRVAGSEPAIAATP
jgi:alpha-ketoglutarate-dependent taurine dioxygenase